MIASPGGSGMGYPSLRSGSDLSVPSQVAQEPCLVSLRHGPRSHCTFPASHMTCPGATFVVSGTDAAEGVGA